MQDDRTQDHTQRMSDMLQGYQLTQMLYVAAELGVADALADGALTIDVLARRCNAHPGALLRLMRALAAHGVFEQRSEGSFGLTDLAATLRGDRADSLRPFALTYGQSWWWDAYGQLLTAARTGVAGFEAAHGMPFFDYLERHPDAAATFNGNMSRMTLSDAAAIAACYAFPPSGLVVDIGGGHGQLIAAVLRRHPDLDGILFDQPSVLTGAAVPPRCRLAEGSFFEQIPAQADLYLLKDILHDWTDQQAHTILANCRRAMHGEARLLVIERLIAPGNEPDAAKRVDITMLALTGGRERTLAEYQQLFGAAGLQLCRVVPLAGGSSILDVRRSRD